MSDNPTTYTDWPHAALVLTARTLRAAVLVQSHEMDRLQGQVESLQRAVVSLQKQLSQIEPLPPCTLIKIKMSTLNPEQQRAVRSLAEQIRVVAYGKRSA